MSKSFKENILPQLIAAAENYSRLIQKTIILESGQFQFQSRYLLKFTETNFLHLTGMISSLNAKDFFARCLTRTIGMDDFSYNETKHKTNIKNKLRCLASITERFDGELMVQEQFVKNRIVCKIATADESFTIGFADGHYCVYPKTILSKNHLDPEKPIVRLKPSIK